MSEADKHQEGGSHYKGRPIQTWNLIITMEWSAFQFEIINYVDRYKRKGGIEDLKKARHWLNKLIEVEETAQGPAVDTSPQSTFVFDGQKLSKTNFSDHDKITLTAFFEDFAKQPVKIDELALRTAAGIQRSSQPLPPQFNGLANED